MRNVDHTSKSKFYSTDNIGGHALAMENYINRVWLNNVLNPLAPSIAPTLFHHMKYMWNLPNYFNPLIKMMREDLLLFSPVEPTVENPLFNPWIPQPIQTPIPPFTSRVEEVIEVTMEEAQPPLFTEISSLRGVSLMLFQEMEDKKYIFNCQENLKKFSIDFRLPFMTQEEKIAVFLSPALRTQIEE